MSLSFDLSIFVSLGGDDPEAVGVFVGGVGGFEGSSGDAFFGSWDEFFGFVFFVNGNLSMLLDEFGDAGGESVEEADELGLENFGRGIGFVVFLIQIFIHRLVE